MPQRLIDGPQGRLNVSQSGDSGATPILFVHSDAGNLHHWDNIRKHLGKRPTAALDRRGHGKSDFPESGSFAHGDAASDIAAAADELGYDRFILVGHSGGALTSLAFSSQEPDRLLGLVLVDPPPDPAILPPGMIEETQEKLNGDDYLETIEAYYRNITGRDPGVVARVLRDARSTRLETMIGTFEAMSRFRPADFLDYEGPALSIIQPQYDVDGALHRIARISHVAIADAGHWIHLAAPDKFTEALKDFIGGIEHPAAAADGARAVAERRTGV